MIVFHGFISSSSLADKWMSVTASVIWNNPLPFPQTDAGMSLRHMQTFRGRSLKAHCFSQSTPIGLDCLGWRRCVSYSCKYPLWLSVMHYRYWTQIHWRLLMVLWLLEHLNLWHFGYYSRYSNQNHVFYSTMLCLCGTNTNWRVGGSIPGSFCHYVKCPWTRHWTQHASQRLGGSAVIRMYTCICPLR